MTSILIVDDDPAMIEQLTRIIRANQWEAQSTVHPQYLFDLLELESIDLILLDFYMPGVTGLVLLQQIKAHPTHHKLPVIILTSDTDESLLAECLELGAKDFITKPVHETILVARILAALEHQTTIQNLQNLNSQLQLELNFAAETQQSLQHEVPSPVFANIAVEQVVRDVVSGDMYRLDESDQGLRCFVGDATGHGMRAALLTMMVNMALNLTSIHQNSDETLRFLNQRLSHCAPEGIFMSAVMLRLEATGNLNLCNAGHPPVLLYQAKTQQVKVSQHAGLALGLAERELVPYRAENWQLERGDKLVVYTNAVLDTRINQAPLGLNGFVAWLKEHGHFPANRLKLELLTYLKSFSQQASFADDLTLIVIEFTQP